MRETGLIIYGKKESIDKTTQDQVWIQGYIMVLGFIFLRLWATVYTCLCQSLGKVVQKHREVIILRKESKFREGLGGKKKENGKKNNLCNSVYCRSLSSQWYWYILTFHQIPNGIYLSMSKPQVMIYLYSKHLKSKVSKKKASCLLKVAGRNNVCEILLPSFLHGIEPCGNKLSQ